MTVKMSFISEIISADVGSTRAILRYSSGAESDNANCFNFFMQMDRQGKCPADLRADESPMAENLSDADWEEAKRILATFP